MNKTPEEIKEQRRQAKNVRSREYYATHKEKKHRYYEDHREQISAKNKAYSATHKERRREYNAAYYAEHREQEITASCAWAQGHKEHRRKYLMNYRATNKEELAVKAKQRWQDHPEKMQEYWHTEKGRLVRKASNAKRRHQRRGLGPIDMKGFYAKCADLQWHCQLCGKELTRETVTIDHIIPVSKGGTNVLENLQPLCFHCNSVKRDKPMKEVVGSQFLFD